MHGFPVRLGPPTRLFSSATGPIDAPEGPTYVPARISRIARALRAEVPSRRSQRKVAVVVRKSAVFLAGLAALVAASLVTATGALSITATTINACVDISGSNKGDIRIV